MSEKKSEVVLVSKLSIAQIMKQGVRMNVEQSKGKVSMSESSLTFSRDLLPGDYDFSEGREYRLIIERMK
jgi:hypothetical protein